MNDASNSENDSSSDEWEPRALDIAPGSITVGRPDHRRLLEEIGEADNWRVVFVGDAAKVGDSDE